jgi:GxxExxY protein
MKPWADLGEALIERDALSEAVIGHALTVHRALGPGLFESAYADCLAHEFELAGVSFAREVPVPLTYKGLKIANAYRLDFLVEDRLVLEIKSVDRFEPVHQAQLLTYLRLTGKRVGLLLNFNEALLKNGILRRVL